MDPNLPIATTDIDFLNLLNKTYTVCFQSGPIG